MQVFFTNLGCKLNQAEVEKLSREFRAAGHEVVSSLPEADLHIVNSCTVTHLAARDSRKVARRGRRVNRRLRTVLTGCYATGAPSEASALQGVDLVVGNEDKDRLVELVHRAFPDALPKSPGPPVPVPYVPLEFSRCRAAVKVEDGCNMRCAFCIIPLTRGRQQSRPVAEVVDEVGELVVAGAKEVVVTGVQISSYRDEDQRLADLVKTLLAETAAPRLRLTSIAPWEFDSRLLELWSDRRLCRHVHLSLQSGCNATLRRMRRPYTAEMYASLVDRIRRTIPGVAITTDVIVGFPGESEEEYQESLGFVEKMGFARVHAFSFSPREGTEAFTLPDRVSHRIIQERVASMLAVARQSEERFWAEHLGARVTVLWEERKGETWCGLTDNYIRVRCRSERDLHNRFSEVRLVELSEGGVRGEQVGSVVPAVA